MMKCKKYILVLFLAIFIGWNRVDAKAQDSDCFYISNGLAVEIESSNGKAYIDRKGWNLLQSNKEDILNLKKNVYAEISFRAIIPGGYDKWFEFPKYAGNNKCPEYVIFYIEDGTKMGRYHAYVSQDEQLAKDFINAVYKYYTGAEVYYAPNMPNMTRDEYLDKYISGVYTYDDKLLEGEKICDLNDPKCSVVEVCDGLFGLKSDPDSVRGILNTIMLYIRVIVPILIILLGSLDFAKAVTVGKEDEMKKAQTRFIKRIIAGIVVFFVPTIIDIIMSLGDMVWDYSYCKF